MRASRYQPPPPAALFDTAKEISAAGLPLNVICQSYPDHRLKRLLETGTRRRCLFQPYLPQARGVDSPTLVIADNTAADGLFPVFDQVFTDMWERSTPL
ncbi:hypothetical protein MTP10_37320 [Nonomuraea sp. 3-1Str]|uniref:hypothetical protein n=1 Tax=Nonomuraea sp. 3-1Str TaxID=2929801 RepID=UPI00285E82F3|nr:hypothetical protein [Nonomuraea sp. 3-1Str]MDR8414379.1 hypothetical protein [Nonomuraea sp. 3-1Str]